jgi:septal ring factor EnvC (AmiA/AmiB activator)
MADNTSELLEEILRWRPWPGPDPALKLLLEEVDQSVRRQILVGYIEQQKAVLQAQVDFNNHLLRAVSARGGAKSGS